MSIGKNITDYIDDNESLTINGDLFWSISPDKQRISVIDESAPVEDWMHDTDGDMVGVKIEGKSNDTNWLSTTMWDIHKLLKGFGGGAFVEGGVYVIDTLVVSTPQQIDYDDKGLRIWTAHYAFRTNN